MNKKSIYLLVLIFMGTTMLFSQNDRQREQRLADYKNKLNLNEKQCEQLQVILMNIDQQGQKERELNKHNPNAQFAADKARKELMDRQIKNILTEEQWETYKKMEKDDPSDRQLLELKERLLLTDEQVAQIQPIMAKTREKIFSLNQNNDDPRKQMQEMKEIMDTQAKEIEKFLTDEQKKKFENLRREKQEEMKRNRPRPGQPRN